MVISSLLNIPKKMFSKTTQNSMYSLFNLLSENIILSQNNFHYNDLNFELSISPLQYDHNNSSHQVYLLSANNNRNDTTNDSISIYTIKNSSIGDQRFLTDLIIVQAYRNRMKLDTTTSNIKSIRFSFKISFPNKTPQCVSWKSLEGIYWLTSTLTFCIFITSNRFYIFVDDCVIIVFVVSGEWSNRGCKTIAENKRNGFTYLLCACDHFSYYGVINDENDVIERDPEAVFHLVVLLCVLISIFIWILLLFIFSCFRSVFQFYFQK